MKFVIAASIVSAALCLPATAQEQTREITGNLTYLPKLALFSDSEVMITVEGAFGTVLGETRFETQGAQVPLPFSVEVVPGLSGRLGALIRIKGLLWWIAQDVTVPAGAEAVDLGLVRMDRFTPLAFATSFDCGGTDVAFGIADDNAVLRVGEREFQMREASAASGARFVAMGDESTEFWSKGDRAMLTVEGQAMGECVETAPASGAYRAGGNEPGWSVVLGETDVAVTADYGAISLSAPRPEVAVVPGAYVFDMPAIKARLTLEDRLCADDATGMPHPHHATLTLDDRTLAGCGGDPASLLTGVEWRIEDIAGKGIVDGSSVTLGIGANGRAFGGTGCNRFAGGYSLTGEGLSFGQMASTMMACPEALMTQERAMLDALGAVTRFAFDETGALLLIGGPADAPLLTARRD